MTTNWTIAVGYRETGIGRTELRYAADLAARLSGTLLVIVPYRAAELDLTSKVTGQNRASLISETSRRVSVRLAALGIPCDAHQIICVSLDSPAADRPRPQIAVGAIGDLLSAEAVVHPADETAATRGPPPLKLLVPHGNGSSGAQTMDFVVRLAAGLKAGIGLYHTTWRANRVASDDPHDHICPAARDIGQEMLRRAAQAGLRAETIIETADDVVEGVIRAAFAGRYGLIAMARSPQILRGSHVEKVIKCSAIPVIEILPRKEPS